MTTQQKQRPAHEIRLGCVKAAIWSNRSDKTGTWYSVTFTRIYKTNNVWKRTHGIGVMDLPQVARLAEQAALWIADAMTRPAIPAPAPTATASQPAA